jgi:hypothetical protein
VLDSIEANEKRPLTSHELKQLRELSDADPALAISVHRAVLGPGCEGAEQALQERCESQDLHLAHILSESVRMKANIWGLPVIPIKLTFLSLKLTFLR